MGLAAPKSRTRISHDPQNTTWANNTSRFGHRILTSQGWAPGSSLGAKDASHASHYTAASHSHIRVLLKDDNLGLGAKRGSEKAENFGLAGLESVLGRLNGREEEVKKEEQRREEAERKGWVARRYGFMNFISGGYLVGDKIERKIKTEAKAEVKEEVVVEEKKAKKRKRDSEVEEVKQEAEQRRLKRKKKSMDLRATAAADEAAESLSSKSKTKKDKKEKKKDKRSKSSTSEPATETATTNTTSPSHSPSPAPEEKLSDKTKRKAEKRARKEEKRLKKALKKAAKEKYKTDSTAHEPTELSLIVEEEEEMAISSSGPTTGTSTPLTSNSGLTFGASGRHAVRQRYIRQKKMASMDPQALKEIFMIKAPA